MSINNLFDLKGKVAIVTGGGNGIGKASCLMLAKAGAAVAVSDLKHEDALKVAEEIKGFGGKAIGVPCNVTKDEDLVNLVETTVKELGGVHVLVNNAGGGGGGRPLRRRTPGWLRPRLGPPRRLRTRPRLGPAPRAGHPAGRSCAPGTPGAAPGRPGGSSPRCPAGRYPPRYPRFPG